MPDIQWQGSRLDTAKGKARALGERFYLETEADLDNILDKECQEEYSSTLVVDQLVTNADVQAIVRKVKPDKCPEANKIPNWFLQSMEEPLIRALQALLTAVNKVSYFLRRFRTACTIVLWKPSKLDYSNLGA